MSALHRKISGDGPGSTDKTVPCVCDNDGFIVDAKLKVRTFQKTDVLLFSIQR